jgi:PhnB protein
MISTVPDGYHTVTPWLISRDTARLLDFVTAAFDAVELARIPNDDGTIGHAEVRIGDAVVMMFDARPSWTPTPGFLRLYVADGDATFRRALSAGAEIVTEMTLLAFGDRVGRVRDPLGNVWWIQQRVEELSFDEMARRAAEPSFAEAMRYVQSAELAPPQTSPPQTSPPQTSPPQTSPPRTSPPRTSPPQTAPPQASPPQTARPQASPPQTSR